MLAINLEEIERVGEVSGGVFWARCQERCFFLVVYLESTGPE